MSRGGERGDCSISSGSPKVLVPALKRGIAERHATGGLGHVLFVVLVFRPSRLLPIREPCAYAAGLMTMAYVVSNRTANIPMCLGEEDEGLVVINTLSKSSFKSLEGEKWIGWEN